MINVSSWSIRNPVASVMVFVLLTLAGLVSFNAMKVQNFPDIDLPTVSITASLPGAAPGQLENDVARKLENAVATLQGLKDEVRRTRAVELLHRTQRPIKQVAEAAGFENEKSFIRAFRGWTGQSPAEFRRAVRV